MALNKNLAKLFDVEPTKPESSKNLIGGTFNSNNFGKDYEMVQNNLKDLIQNGNIALESALKVATESDSPRAFEVVAIILKTMADLNNNVLSVHKSARDITSGSATKLTQTNNSVFVGSTKDLQNLLNKERSTEKVIDVEVINEGAKQQ
jgi:ACT domain-containing protein